MFNQLKVKIRRHSRRKGHKMLWILYVLLFGLWLVLLVTGNLFGGFSHILLVIAIGVMLFKIYQGTNKSLSGE